MYEANSLITLLSPAILKMSYLWYVTMADREVAGKFVTGALVKQVECFLRVQETGVQSQVESHQRLKKWHLMLLCLTLSIIKYGSRVKWSNPGNGVVLSPTPWCSSY